MRCKKCRGIMSHWIISTHGENYYKCHTGLTSFDRDKYGIISRESRIVLCGTVQNMNYEVIQPGRTLAFKRGRDTEIVTV